MNSLLILHNCLLLVLANRWWERSPSFQEWPYNQVHTETQFDDDFWRPYSDRVYRETSNEHSRFHINTLRNELRTMEMNFWCHTYSSCAYEGFTFYTLYNETIPKQEHYFGAMMALLDRVHGKKFTSARLSHELSSRRERMEKLEAIIFHIANSWTNVFAHFMKVELPEIHIPKEFVDIFSRVVQLDRLDETLKRAQSVLSNWPKQFLTNAAKEFLSVSEIPATTPPPPPPHPAPAPPAIEEPRTDEDSPVGEFYRRYFGYPAGIQSMYRQDRRRRATTMNIKTSYQRNRTINETTQIMSETLGFIFDAHAKLFIEPVSFLTAMDVEFTDTSILAFKSLLDDSYEKILLENRSPHGPIITDLRDDMIKDMVKMENDFKAYWGYQMQYLTNISTTAFVEKARKDTLSFLKVFVFCQPMEQVTEAYIRLERLGAEIKEETRFIYEN